MLPVISSAELLRNWDFNFLDQEFFVEILKKSYFKKKLST